MLHMPLVSIGDRIPASANSTLALQRGTSSGSPDQGAAASDTSPPLFMFPEDLVHATHTPSYGYDGLYRENACPSSQAQRLPPKGGSLLRTDLLLTRSVKDSTMDQKSDRTNSLSSKTKFAVSEVSSRPRGGLGCQACTVSQEDSISDLQSSAHWMPHSPLAANTHMYISPDAIPRGASSLELVPDVIPPDAAATPSTTTCNPPAAACEPEPLQAASREIKQDTLLFRATGFLSSQSNADGTLPAAPAIPTSDRSAVGREAVPSHSTLPSDIVKAVPLGPVTQLLDSDCSGNGALVSGGFVHNGSTHIEQPAQQHPPAQILPALECDFGAVKNISRVGDSEALRVLYQMRILYGSQGSVGESEQGGSPSRMGGICSPPRSYDAQPQKATRTLSRTQQLKAA